MVILNIIAPAALLVLTLVTLGWRFTSQRLQLQLVPVAVKA